MKADYEKRKRRVVRSGDEKRTGDEKRKRQVVKSDDEKRTGDEKRKRQVVKSGDEKRKERVVKSGDEKRKRRVVKSGDEKRKRRVVRSGDEKRKEWVMKAGDEERKEQAAVWIHGINSVMSMIESHSKGVLNIYTAQGARNPRLSLVCQAGKNKGIECGVKPVEELDRIVGGSNHQGVVSLCNLPTYLGEGDLQRLCVEDAIFLILDQVTDPVNFGTCLRNAEAFGATAVIVLSKHAARLTSVVVKVASGAVGWIPIVQVVNLARAIALLKKSGVWVVGTLVGAGQDLSAVNCRRPIALVLGAEGGGLRKRTAELCDYLVTVRLPGKVGSLNVSAASAVCFYEVHRQRRGSTQGK